MTREDANKLLTKIRELSERDVLIQTFLKLAEMEAKAEVMDLNASQEFIDDVIINKSLGKLSGDLLAIQASRIKVLENELNVSLDQNRGC